MSERRGHECAQDVPAQLAQLAADLGPALTPLTHAELLGSIASTATRVFRASACSLALLDEGRQELVFHVASGGAAEEIVGVRVPLGHGIAGWVATSGQPLVVDDVSRDPRFATDVAQATGYMPRSILAMPLETKRDLVGVMELLDAAPESRDMELLGAFAHQTALILEASRAFSDLGRTLFQAAAAATGGDLAAALQQQARNAPEPHADLAQLASYFAELGRLGAPARAAATHLVGDFLAYARLNPALS